MVVKRYSRFDSPVVGAGTKYRVSSGRVHVLVGDCLHISVLVGIGDPLLVQRLLLDEPTLDSGLSPRDTHRPVSSTFTVFSVYSTVLHGEVESLYLTINTLAVSLFEYPALKYTIFVDTRFKLPS